METSAMLKCPHCGGEISPAAILGKEGGKKSRRVLTTKQAMEMVEARERKKQEKEKRDEQKAS